MIVKYRKKARIAILNATLYIEEQGYPINADKFYERILEFGDSLTTFPEKYGLCHSNQFAARNLRCAVFEKNYIFIYKILKHEIVIVNIIHAKRLK
ncbi:MAG: hypothetical protein HW421_3926 [Ignavibacteria bacterium]|nr:hypothetical protein [Ignavibacteria bacterium]